MRCSPVHQRLFVLFLFKWPTQRSCLRSTVNALHEIRLSSSIYSHQGSSPWLVRQGFRHPTNQRFAIRDNDDALATQIPICAAHHALQQPNGRTRASGKPHVLTFSSVAMRFVSLYYPHWHSGHEPLSDVPDNGGFSRCIQEQ